VVTVKKSDFEVMDALAMDSVQQQSQKASNDEIFLNYNILRIFLSK
jgi:hypothetical protein